MICWYEKQYIISMTHKITQLQRFSAVSVVTVNEVQVGKDQEKAQSEKIPTPKPEMGKN